MRSVLVPLNEAARRNLNTHHPLHIDARTRDSGTDATSHAVTQLERSQQRLGRNIQRRQLALAQQRLQDMRLNAPLDDTDTRAKAEVDHLKQHLNSINTEASHAIRDDDQRVQSKMEAAMENLKIDCGRRIPASLRSIKRRHRDRLKLELNQRQHNTGNVSVTAEKVLQEDGTAYYSNAGLRLGQKDLPQP
ncbi:hypothetical protein M409DRAFT_57032 [Zasmidium cellare ATCC 36951]|uniref:Uncharacterized protein n=1 Tax=Zasmidium cellare ATCC 36951 TaxID=1080233 RepID=A0A6A6CA51_ZASCE|nr:uncharacterized protein M409DRAFT_57032 [Zasmidium cellare ATCC 36951]KAF2163921.1 hypothetical protein M409DRAFT_57032 [Zasmidium cellare ATCC 36951]